MSPRARLAGLVWVLASTMAGCVVPTKGGFPEVADIVAKRFGPTIHWYQGGSADTQALGTVGRILAEDLTLESAIQLALLNNRSLQARFEDLGIGQADLVQAGLLKNPSIGGLVRFPGNVELGWVQDLVDLLMLPARKRLAALEFEETKLRVTHEVLDLIADVKVGFFTLQGQLLQTEILETTAQAGRVALAFAESQFAAGTINELDLLMRQASYEEAKLQLFHSQSAVLQMREQLTRALGVWGEDAAWTLAGRLPAVPETSTRIMGLESLALSTRLDLAAARLESQTIAEALDIKQLWRWIPLAEAGVSAERESEGTWLTGPSLSLELPLFDQGQAEVASLVSSLRRSQRQEEALAVHIRSEVHEQRNLLVAHRKQAEHYLQTVIPLHEQIVLKTQEHYNFMLVGLYQLLEAKSAELSAYMHYIEALRGYWVSRAELARAVGGPLP